jgi:hypothetical protein
MEGKMNLIDRLDNYLLSGEQRQRRSHHPSDVTSCLRQLYYKWNNVPMSDPPTAGNIIKMRFGDGAEAIVRKWLEWERDARKVVEFAEQVEVSAVHHDLGYPIHGYEDFVVWPTDGKPFGVEVKSSYGRGIKEIQQQGQPKPEHLWQVYPYMLYNKRELYYLLYIGRDNGYRTQFELTMDKDGTMYVNGRPQEINEKAFIDKLVAAEHTVGAAVPPECQYKAVIKDGEIKDKVQRHGVEYKSDWQTRYCAWRSLCHKNELQCSAKNGTIYYGGKQI